VRTVYTVAFIGNEFLMVYNPKRKGWEMPGGHVEAGESDERAAVREYMEETGHEITLVAATARDDVRIFAATLGPRTGDGEYGCRMFTELPDDLGFDRSEYDDVTEWARSVMF
jgi:8-oxo-dGTP diphosphatase